MKFATVVLVLGLLIAGCLNNAESKSTVVVVSKVPANIIVACDEGGQTRYHSIGMPNKIARKYGVGMVDGKITKFDETEMFYHDYEKDIGVCDEIRVESSREIVSIFGRYTFQVLEGDNVVYKNNFIGDIDIEYADEGGKSYKIRVDYRS